MIDRTLEFGSLLPIGPECRDESGLEIFQGVEHQVGENPAQRLEPVFHRVELGAVGGSGNFSMPSGQWILPLE
jgi:hypothetical protein